MTNNLPYIIFLIISLGKKTYIRQAYELVESYNKAMSV